MKCYQNLSERMNEWMNVDLTVLTTGTSQKQTLKPNSTSQQQSQGRAGSRTTPQRKFLAILMEKNCCQWGLFGNLCNPPLLSELPPKTIDLGSLCTEQIKPGTQPDAHMGMDWHPQLQITHDRDWYSQWPQSAPSSTWNQGPHNS